MPVAVDITGPLTGRTVTGIAAGGSHSLVIVGATGIVDAPPKPRIDFIRPATAPSGTKVLIAGADFSSVLAENVVRFGNVPALVDSGTAAELVAFVSFGITGSTKVTVSRQLATSLPADFEVLPALTTFAKLNTRRESDEKLTLF